MTCIFNWTNIIKLISNFLTTQSIILIINIPDKKLIIISESFILLKKSNYLLPKSLSSRFLGTNK